jgi:hypothetical protein
MPLCLQPLPPSDRYDAKFISAWRGSALQLTNTTPATHTSTASAAITPILQPAKHALSVRTNTGLRVVIPPLALHKATTQGLAEGAVKVNTVASPGTADGGVAVSVAAVTGVAAARHQRKHESTISFKVAASSSSSSAEKHHTTIPMPSISTSDDVPSKSTQHDRSKAVKRGAKSGGFLAGLRGLFTRPKRQHSGGSNGAGIAGGLSERPTARLAGQRPLGALVIEVLDTGAS